MPASTSFVWEQSLQKVLRKPLAFPFMLCVLKSINTQQCLEFKKYTRMSQYVEWAKQVEFIFDMYLCLDFGTVYETHHPADKTWNTVI